MMTDQLSQPIQSRSRATMERILTVVEQMLEEECFDEISINQILAKSGVSSGSFYARFSGKAAMLPVLVDRHEASRSEFLGKSLDPKDWQDPSLRQTVDRMVQLFTRYFSKEKGIIRALVMYYRTHPEKLDRSKRAQLSEGFKKVVDILAMPRPELEAERDEIAVLVDIMFASIREAILFPPWGKANPSRAKLVRALSHCLYSSLSNRSEN